MDYQLMIYPHVVPPSERSVKKCLRRPKNRVGTFPSTTRAEFRGEFLRIYTYLGLSTQTVGPLIVVAAMSVVVFDSASGCFEVEFLSL